MRERRNSSQFEKALSILFPEIHRSTLLKSQKKLSKGSIPSLRSLQTLAPGHNSFREKSSSPAIFIKCSLFPPLGRRARKNFSGLAKINGPRERKRMVPPPSLPPVLLDMSDMFFFSSWLKCAFSLAKKEREALLVVGCFLSLLSQTVASLFLVFRTESYKKSMSVPKRDQQVCVWSYCNRK